MRNLASIQTVVDLQPIPDKDKIEYATVLGWHVITRVGEFKIGDKCVYFEIDVKTPETEVFEFLRPRDFRIRTLKMAGVVSQGLALPLSSFAEFKGKDLPVGKDVTDILGITKYDPEGEKEAKLFAEKQALETNKLKKFLMKNKWYRKLFTPKKESKGFPKWIKKTDETRVQTMPFLFRHTDNEERVFLSVTEKIDGTSSTYFYVNQKGWFRKPVFGVCSRNIYLQKQDGSVYWENAITHDLKNVLKAIAEQHKAKTVVLQGESIGPSIQGDKYKIGKKFFAFNLVIDNNRLSTIEMKKILEQFKIDTVPIISEAFILPDTCDEMIAFSNGDSLLNSKVKREGVVCRNGNLSFKAVSPDFLLKYKE